MKMILVFLLACSPVFAKWAPLNEEDLIAYATDIVVADFVKVGEEKEGMHFGSFRVVERWKGAAGETIKLRGTSLRICAPVVNFKLFKKGRYLLVLTKKEGIYHPFNGPFSAVKVTEEKLQWFDSPQGFDRETQTLVEVKERVAGVMKAQEIAAGKKAAEADLKAGKIHYGLVGQPMMIDQKLKKEALAKFGVTVISHGCTGPPNRAHFEGYQKAVVAFLTKKYGNDSIATLQKELMERAAD